MPIFRCFIRGDNFLGKLIGEKKPIGLYTTRFVVADSPQQAEMHAVELLRDHPYLVVSAKYCTQDAQVFFEKIDEMPDGTDQKPNKGFTFFIMST